MSESEIKKTHTLSHSKQAIAEYKSITYTKDIKRSAMGLSSVFERIRAFFVIKAK